MTTTKHPWKDDEQRNWEYGDFLLRAGKYILRAGSSTQTVSLRGHLLIDIAVTQLLRSKAPSGIGEVTRTSFRHKVNKAEICGIISSQIKSLLIDIARIRNAQAHELASPCSFRHVFALTVRAREAGIEDRFHSHHEEMELRQRVESMGELADHLFDPGSELAELCADIFSHLVFWSYDSFDLASLRRILDKIH